MRYTILIETAIESYERCASNFTIDADDRIDALEKAKALSEHIAGDFCSLNITAAPSFKEKKEVKKPYVERDQEKISD